MIDLSPSKSKVEVGSNKIFLFLCGAFVTIILLMVWSKVSTIQEDLKYIAAETVKVRTTRAALNGMTCIACHGPDNPSQMLPLRSLNQSAFKNYLRGERVGLGYSACPIYSKDTLSDSDISKVYAILYSSGK